MKISHLRFFLIITAFFLLLNASTHAANIDLEMRKARAFYESGEYPQAIIIYQNLLQEPLKSWQPSIIMYNLGCTYLAAGQWKKTMATFNAISLDNPLGPLLNYRIKRNMIIAFIRQAASIKSDQPLESLELLNKADQQIEIVQKAYCNLENVEGNPKCTTYPGAVTFRNVILQQKALAMLEQEKQIVTKSDLKEGLPLLLSGINEEYSKITFLEQPLLQEDLKKEYLKLFDDESKTWNILWSTLKNKLSALQKMNDYKKRMDLFSTAESGFHQGVEFMQQGKLSESRKAFDTSAAALKELIAMPPPPSKTSTPEKEAPPQQNKAEEATPKESEQKMNQVLQLLIEMDRQDNPKKPQQSVKKVERPW
jgi:hypothetical protein